MIFSTILKGKFAGAALVFPPEWQRERVASALSALDAEVTISRPYVVTDDAEISRVIATVQEMNAGSPADEVHTYHLLERPHENKEDS